jgi:hypothetical protein
MHVGTSLDSQHPEEKAHAAGTQHPNIAGNWSGQLTQVDNQAPYKFELVRE